MVGAARLMFRGVEVPENSLVVHDAIGNNTDGPDNNTLMCVTDYTPCCTGDNVSGWYWDFRNSPPIPMSGSSLTMSQGNQVVHLRRPRTPSHEGIFWCRIQVTANTFQDLYVGVYGRNDSDGDGDGESVKCAAKCYMVVVGV